MSIAIRVDWTPPPGTGVNAHTHWRHKHPDEQNAHMIGKSEARKVIERKRWECPDIPVLVAVIHWEKKSRKKDADNALNCVKHLKISHNGAKIGILRGMEKIGGAVLETPSAMTPKGLASMRQYSIPPRQWTPEDDTYLEDHYLTQTHEEIAQAIGRTEHAVRNRCYVLRLRKEPPGWTAGELGMLRQWYEERDGKPLNLDDLAKHLGRLKSNVSRKARELGLTNRRRTYVEKINGYYPSAAPKFTNKDELREHLSRSMKEWIATNGHPRGALGMKHSSEVVEASRARMNPMHERLTSEEKHEMGRRAARTRIEKYGTAGPVNIENPYSRARGGKRADLGDMYFRSAWEANYARYLNWLEGQGEIRGWEYEADTFVFEGYTRGAMTYRPDFKVTEKDGRIVYHEVKGWMDGPSKTRLKRMAKHYPDVEVIVIGESEYKAIKKWAGMIPGWE